MTIDPQTADVKALAEALRRQCKIVLGPVAILARSPWELQFAAALLGVVEECEKWTGKPKGLGEAITGAVVSSILRAAAERYVAAGGKMEE